ncbi:Heat shock protein DnaJ N-terminal [Penicillium angulare]|uniref:Heat shock protein DnaJ N-terminal n=1 Tax=Penicillium angulare TaxID=116970 RepID=A0A9W9FTF9_9EURO|nr:Heat shock protein DnaJ N-terminal [Penicillium angulare]
MDSPLATTNYYTALEVSHDATDQQISAAYKRLVLIHHPDKTGGDQASADKFRLIQQAIEVLRDPARRLLHDRKLQLQPTTSYKKRDRRYHSSDDRRNWYKEDISWSTGRKDWNFNDPADRYLFTYGTCVHMDPDSEASREEMARHEHDQEEWAMRWAGIDPEVEKAKEQYRRELMEAGIVWEGEEPGNVMHSDQAGPTEEEKRADEYLEGTDESILSDDDWFYYGLEKQESHHHRDVVETGFNGHADSNPDAASMPSQPSIVVNGGCLIDLSDSEPPESNTHVLYRAKEAYEPVGLDESIKSLSPTPRNEPESLTEEKVTELLQPFIPFFRMKLSKYRTQYSEDDMHAEIQGLMLEIYDSWLGGIRNSFNDSKSLEIGNDKQPCSHLGVWYRLSGMPACPKCHLWMPVFVLTCSGCSIKACVRCKFARDS